MVIPLDEPGILGSLIDNLMQANREGPNPWIDPAVIVRTERPLKILDKFVDKHFVSLAREREEFYSVLIDRKKADVLEKYIDRLCEKTTIGRLKRSDVVFFPSQVNIEFARYLASLQGQL